MNNPEKTYLTRFYNLDTNEVCSGRKTMKELVEIDTLVRMGGLSIYPGKGYFWKYDTLKDTLERLHGSKESLTYF